MELSKMEPFKADNAKMETRIETMTSDLQKLADQLISEVKAKLEALEGKGMDKGHALFNSVDQRVHERPWHFATLMALSTAAIAFLLGRASKH